MPSGAPSTEFMFSPLIDQLMEALRCLPGVGPKSAQRMAFHLLEGRQSEALALAHALQTAAENVRRCTQCRTLTEDEICAICKSAERDRGLLCVVETPADVWSIERATSYRGLYFVLMGHLSPLDGIGPAELGLNELEQRFGGGELKEIILATNSTVEGEATAHYVGEMASRAGVRASRIAHGVPLGGELEYVDGSTLARAFSDRRDLS